MTNLKLPLFIMSAVAAIVVLTGCAIDTSAPDVPEPPMAETAKPDDPGAKQVHFDKLPHCRPVFNADGLVTEYVCPMPNPHPNDCGNDCGGTAVDPTFPEEDLNLEF